MLSFGSRTFAGTLCKKVCKVLLFRTNSPAVEPWSIREFVIDYLFRCEEQLDFVTSRFRAVRAVNEIISLGAAEVSANSARLGFISECAAYHPADHIYTTVGFPYH